MSHIQGKFVWYEHFSADPARARAFYGPLFGWHVEDLPMGEQRYPLIMNAADGIGGFRSAAAGAPAHWLSYLSVEDVDRAHAAALAAGAKAVMPPTDFAPVGRGSVLADPTGAVFSLWTSAQGDKPDVAEAPMGHWCWTELTTTDEQRALAFYEQVVGYTHDAMDMGPGGSYYILKAAGQGRGGLMRNPPGMTAPPMWLPYVKVPDADATAAKAAALGGTVVVPPTDIPNIGRFAVFADPTGATIALLQPSM